MVHQTIVSYEGEDREWTPLCFTANTAGSTWGIYSSGSTPSNITIEVSDNGEDWSTYPINYGSSTFTAAGAKVYVRNTSTTQTTFSTSSNYIYFVVTGNVSVSGDITTLLKKDGKVNSLTSSGSYCFYKLFYNCTGLVDAIYLLLPSSILTMACYASMLRGCTSLLTPPSLPSTNLSKWCYASLFNGCTSLSTTPSLPATILADGCYEYLFAGCSSITTPPILSSTSIVEGCYASMFINCTALTSVPELLSTTIKLGCYDNLFAGCTQLKWSTTPDLITPYLSYKFPTSSVSLGVDAPLIDTSGSPLYPEYGVQYYCNVPFNTQN